MARASPAVMPGQRIRPAAKPRSIKQTSRHRRVRRLLSDVLPMLRCARTLTTRWSYGRMTTDAYKALAEVVLVERPLDHVLNEVAAIAQAWLPGSEATSITLMRADKAWTAAYSHRLALDADELQYKEGYGPCMDAGRTGMPMVVTDMRTEERWPTPTPRVLERGVSATVRSAPFQGLTIGALNNYSREPNAFGDDAEAWRDRQLHRNRGDERTAHAEAAARRPNTCSRRLSRARPSTWRWAYSSQPTTAPPKGHSQSCPSLAEAQPCCANWQRTS